MLKPKHPLYLLNRCNIRIETPTVLIKSSATCVGPKQSMGNSQKCSHDCNASQTPHSLIMQHANLGHTQNAVVIFTQIPAKSQTHFRHPPPIRLIITVKERKSNPKTLYRPSLSLAIVHRKQSQKVNREETVDEVNQHWVYFT
jgi:hypothetical protein